MLLGLFAVIVLTYKRTKTDKMEHQTIFIQLSLVIVVGVIVSFIMRLLRQPLIMGYILTGIVVGPSFLHLIKDVPTFQTFSDIGISLLLFIIGLGLNTTIIRRMGRVVVIAAGVQMLLTLGIGYGVAAGLGYSPLVALIIGTSLTFSSTIIIIKLINDKREQTRQYARIAVGILLLQDIVATLALVFLAAGKTGGFSVNELLLLGLKGLVLALGLILVSTKIMPRLLKIVASSQELLFLFALAWGFGIATLFQISGFSIEVGALFAGVSLASLPYAQEITARLKPLRDFFIVVFFIALGQGLQIHNLLGAIVPAIVFSLVVIFIKPLIVLSTMGILGYTKRTSFKTAISLAQISEFSLVFIVIATTQGLISPEVSAMVTLAAIITIAASTYLIQYDDRLFTRLEHHLRLFERKVIKNDQKAVASYPLVLFGYRKGGHEFVKTFRSMHKRFVVVDYNPEVIETLENQHIHYVYGDATDLELLEEISIHEAKLIISTITDSLTNQTLARHIHRNNPEAVFICHADSYDQAIELYNLGATYVMLPHFIGSEQISSFIRKKGMSREAFDTYRQKHLINLGRAALH